MKGTRLLKWLGLVAGGGMLLQSTGCGDQVLASVANIAIPLVLQLLLGAVT
ncbi:MAG TPA: hypothetical protein VLM89_00510 [Phycisphaerae bacterium]|nr:hypothetical protein [Phycisphaerae bacterium]